MVVRQREEREPMGSSSLSVPLFYIVGPELMQATNEEDTKKEDKDDSSQGMASLWKQISRVRLFNKLALLGSRECKRDL